MKKIVLAVLAAWCALDAGAAAARDVVVHAGHLIDGTGAAPRSQVSILITDDRITAIEPGYVRPADAEIVDLTGATVLPGLIDCHVHILSTFHKGDPVRNAVTRTSYDDLVDGVNDVRASLLAGFTSLRSLGDDTRAVAALRRNVAAGVVPGPRLWVSGAALGPTAGHSDHANGLDPALSHPEWAEGVIDNPEEARRAVRLHHREGANVIKIMPSGGVMSIGDNPRLQLMADDEIAAVVAAAHALDMKVAAHAHGKAAIDRAVALGVDSIEHGTYADAESFALMKRHGTYLVPTMLVAERVYERAKTHPEQLNPSTAEKALEVAPRIRNNLRNAYRAGVKIAFGTDTFGLSAHGENAQEFALLVGAGLTPMEAILTATRNAADLIGASQDIGSVQAGRYADLIAVDGDPVADVRVLEDVPFVMKGGIVVKRDGRSRL